MYYIIRLRTAPPPTVVGVAAQRRSFYTIRHNCEEKKLFMNIVLMVAVISHWIVDPMGETRHLPDQVPADGCFGAPIGIIAAKGEYEPASFILRSDSDLGRVTFDVGDLKTEDGKVFPKAKLDLKTVKVWWQNGNAWVSYFADKGKKLCPELLLNDEDLVKVDFEKQCNYARTTEKDGTVGYYWLGDPKAFHSRVSDVRGYAREQDTFQCMKPNFCDAPAHCGATLPKDFSKQFFLTAHVTKDQPAGIYKGEVKVKGQGQQWNIPVILRVLDFELPEPMCYEDVNKPFRTWFCDYTSHWAIRKLNGDDPVLARKQLEAICADLARHGQTIPSFSDNRNEIDVVRRSGQVFDENVLLFGMELTDTIADSRADARKWRRYCDKMFGKDSRPLAGWGDEFGEASMHGIITMVELYQSFGFRFQVNSLYCWEIAPHLADLYWTTGEPDQSQANKADRVRQMTGDHAYTGWYAAQHVGCENPGYVRRQYGFGPYRAGLSCHYNYAHHLSGWNDSTDDLYKPMMSFYGSGNGCIDTLQHEAMREGLDDIRYATVLKRLALPLSDSRDNEARYAARYALRQLGEEKQDDKNLTTLRLEMIRHILKLQRFNRQVARSEGGVTK